MPWMRLQFQPGIIKDATRYASTGTWIDGNLIRFREGLPETWFGWVHTLTHLSMHGFCRSISRHVDLINVRRHAFGTSKRFYVSTSDAASDVSPVEDAVVLGAAKLTTTNGSTSLKVTDAAHAKLVGYVVILSGAVDTNGIPAAEINTTHSIATIIDNDNYTVNVTTAATSSGASSGDNVSAQYYVVFGADSAGSIDGWGADGWGMDSWGSTSDAVAMGVWSQDSWGEDIVACPAGGAIYYWDATSPSARMVDILDLASADGNAPTAAEFIVVSHRDRHLIAFGATEFSSGDESPMNIRWCDQENILNWDDADTTGTAGSLPLSHGSKFMAALSTNREILTWTDEALYSLQYVGAPFIYTADLIERGTDIAGQKAAVHFNGITYWMGRTGFYAYTGRVEKLPCPVWDYIESRINASQGGKVVAATNRRHNEVLFFYQSEDGDDCDSYVAFDVLQHIWTIGTLGRSAWIDGDSTTNPLAASPDGELFDHENGFEDGSESPAVPLDSYVESAPFELSSEGSFDKGDRMMFIRRLVPDVTFRGYDGGNPPSMNLVLKAMNFPGSGMDSNQPSGTVGRSVELPVETFTDQLHVRLRGRALTLRAETGNAATHWRLGVPRIDVRPDGQRG